MKTFPGNNLTENGWTMIEVFKTNVESPDEAMMLIEQIHKNFSEYRANFDLHDCDNILRIKSATTYIHTDRLIDFLKHYGFHAEVLPDECMAVRSIYASWRVVATSHALQRLNFSEAILLWALDDGTVRYVISIIKHRNRILHAR